MNNKIQQIINRKNGEKLVCLTAYSYPIAKILDDFCDIILVGDSLGMTIYGLPDTIDVSLEMMINHGKAVMRAAKKSLVVVDLPFGTYEKNRQQALESAKKLISETGCDAVKIEISKDLIDTAKFLVDNQINLMGHVGLLPQSVRKIGGYKYQGRDENSASEILQTAKAIDKLGAFSLVIEAVPAKLADQISNAVSIPTIGIGASRNCDGQILVIDDLIALNKEFKPKFVKHYADVANEIYRAAERFKNDIKKGNFPSDENEF